VVHPADGSVTRSRAAGDTDRSRRVGKPRISVIEATVNGTVSANRPATPTGQRHPLAPARSGHSVVQDQLRPGPPGSSERRRRWSARPEGGPISRFRLRRYGRGPGFYDVVSVSAERPVYRVGRERGIAALNLQRDRPCSGSCGCWAAFVARRCRTERRRGRASAPVALPRHQTDDDQNQ